MDVKGRGREVGTESCSRSPPSRKECRLESRSGACAAQGPFVAASRREKSLDGPPIEYPC